LSGNKFDKVKLIFKKREFVATKQKTPVPNFRDEGNSRGTTQIHQ